jgi:23S rRNA (guanosine2251-2'-O)-methyltransferase
VREIIYGRQPVRECLLARRRHIHQLILAEGVKDAAVVGEIVNLAVDLKIPIKHVPRQQLDRLAGPHQGVALEAGRYPYADMEAILRRAQKLDQPPFILALDHLQDPHNLGALLRTAEVVGVHGVVIPKRRAASVTPAVVSASAGASEHVQIAQVTNLVRALEALKAKNIWVIGLQNSPDARPYDQVDLNLPLVLLVGAEGKGLSRLASKVCDVLIRLPVRGRVESLNASVAGGVAMYAALSAREFSAE